MIVLALMIGIVAGLRAFLAPAAVAWAAQFGMLSLDGPFLLLANRFAPWLLSLFALVELVADQLPATPSRKVPLQFGTRLITGGLSGAAIGASSDLLLAGLAAGVVGAVIGTYGGAAARAAIARAFGRDWPAALIEDAVAILGAVAIFVL